MNPRTCVLTAALASLLLLPASGADIKRSEVESVLREALAAMRIDAPLISDSLRFAGGLVNGAGGAKLIVERAAITPEGHVDARLRCEPRNSCLPFYVSADLAENGHSPNALTWVATGKHAVAPQKPIVKAGERVVFVSDTQGSRILLQAITLEAGAPGSLVRVRAIDGKREILRGRLCDGGIVRSET